MSIFYWFCWVVAYLPIRILWPTTVVNKKNLHVKSKQIFACNHMSNLDPVILKSHQHKKSYVLAKHTLFKNKFVGACLKAFGGIPVNREEVGISTIKTTIKLLNDNHQLLIFPEGTRKTSIDDANALKNGMALFALKTNTSITPMVFLKKPKLFRFNKILVGEPIDMSAYEGQKPTKEVLSEISDKVLNEMQNLRNDYIASLPEKKQAKLLKQI
ncbi:MAG: 1-acyl-sn-glycerol-3-phosphate acyltransferase [Clostridia bacterium]|nr:1-acyl-sn-glycerol-3-phosphate acyltransferase [Clostridia bacterium]